MAVVLKELWLAMLLEKLRFTNTWATGLKNETSFVGNNVIHLTEIGADPNVLIDNTIYPIAVSSREDNDVTVALKKYDTENTRIRRDELYALPYDKTGSVLDQHQKALEEKMMAHGLYTIAPLSNQTKTPVLVTTGADDGTGRKRLKVADIIKLQRVMNDLKIPAKGRKLVLCSEHQEDLLLESQTFREQYSIIASGVVLPLYGFEIHLSLDTVRYNGTTKVRVAFGAASAGTDANASIAFYDGRCFQAMGGNSMFYRDAETDPEQRATVVGFQQYGIIMPYQRDSQAAIISGKTS